MNCIFSTICVFLCLLISSDLQIVSCEANPTTYLSRNKRQSGNDGVTCELPLQPINGKWTIINGVGRPGDRVSKNTVLRFECDPEYKLSSVTSFLLCDEHWNLSKVPICERKCPPKYSTSTTNLKCEDKYGNEVSCTEAVDGTYLSYTCASFFETPLGYKKTILCVDGSWNFPNPVCQPICGKRIDAKETVPLIVNGIKKEQREYPWIIAIYQKLDDNFSNICGGTLVSQRVIISAAHCVTNDFGDKLRPEQFMVGAGKYYNKFHDSRDVNVQYSEVARIVVNSGYRGAPQRFLADIALLITKDLVTVNNIVQPVCYQDLPNIHLQAGKIGVVAGWGKTETGDQPEELRTLEIPFKHQTTCAQELPTDWAHRFNTIDKLCAGFFNQNKSVCTGDSGSGLYFKNPEDNRYYIHGVVSIAPAEKGECNPQQNSLYTNVAYYYEFVDRETTKQYVQQCTLPLYPNNGKWVVPKLEKKPGDIVPSNTVLKVECDEGYELSSSNAYLDCQSAYVMPKCELLCPKLHLPQGATLKCHNRRGEEIDCSKATDGSSLAYTCPEGYTMPSGGEKTKFCNGGSWGQEPKCVARGVEQGINAKQKKVVACSYAGWYAYDKIFPEDFNTTLCTHIVYSFAELLDKGNIKALNEHFELDQRRKGMFRRFTDLKKNNTDLKVLLSIGRTDGTDASRFSGMAKSPVKKNAFIYSTLSLLEEYNFDGMNIEWFYPRNTDKASYTKLLQDLRKKCDEKGLLLTASVFSTVDKTGYDGEEMSKVLDFITLRTYDFYGPWSSYTGQNSPLYASSVENNWEKNHLNIDVTAKNWLKLGVPRSKIVISVAFYGRSFVLKDKEENTLHAPFTSAGLGEGFLRYSKICTIKGFNNWTTVWDDEQESIISYNEDQWIGYDNNETIKIKAAYVKNNGFLGVNVWPLDGDDVLGNCGPKQVLLKHVHMGLGNF